MSPGTLDCPSPRCRDFSRVSKRRGSSSALAESAATRSVQVWSASPAGLVPLGTLKEVTHPYLRDLTEATGESSGLTVPDGNTALYLDHVPSDGTVRTRDWTGMRFPFHTIASGLALMMTWSEASVERLADRGLETFTEHTITTKEELISRLTKARRQGFVWTMGDFDLEINGVAAPVRNQQGGAIGAISTYGPSYRFPGDKDMGRLAERVRETARLVQEQIRA